METKSGKDSVAADSKTVIVSSGCVDPSSTVDSPDIPVIAVAIEPASLPCRKLGRRGLSSSLGSTSAAAAAQEVSATGTGTPSLSLAAEQELARSVVTLERGLLRT